MGKKSKAAEVVAKPTGLRVMSMEVENVKRIKFVSLVPQGDLIEVGGKNGQGKTSILDAISWALTGSGDIPTQPIRNGQRTAKIKVDVGDFVVTRTFTRVDAERSEKGLHFLSKLAVEGKNREQFRSPQELLNKLMGSFTFDPLAFVRMEPKAQLKAMRSLVRFDVDIDELERESKVAYDARRDLGRDLRTAQAWVETLPESPADLPAHPIDTMALTQQLEQVAVHNGEVLKAENTKQQHAKDYADCQHAIKVRKQNIEAYQQEIRDIEKKILELDGEIDEYDDKGKSAQKAYHSATVPELMDAADISRQLQEATETNRRIAAREVRRRAVDEAAKLQASYDEQDKLYTDKQEERSKAIAEAKMPLDGMSIGDGEVLYAGLPFNQASNAEQIKVSVAMAMAANPTLRVMCIRDGSLLDDESMALLREMANAENYQMWVERVGGDGKVGIVMEDGEAHGEGVQPQPSK